GTQARANPAITLGMAAACIAVLWLLIASGYQAFTGENRGNVVYAALGGLAGFGATAFGAVFAFSLREVSTRTQDTMLGFAAGMMLAASSFSLILPGLEAAEAVLGSGFGGAFVVVVGLSLGVLLMLGLDH